MLAESNIMLRAMGSLAGVTFRVSSLPIPPAFLYRVRRFDTGLYNTAECAKPRRSITLSNTPPTLASPGVPGVEFDLSLQRIFLTGGKFEVLSTELGASSESLRP